MLDLTIQVDGQQAIESSTLQNDGGQVALLPASIWRCFTRPTQVVQVPSRGAPKMWMKELVCYVPDKDGSAIVQAGTMTGCGELAPEESSFLGLREKNRAFKFTIKCSMPVAAPRAVLQ